MSRTLIHVDEVLVRQIATSVIGSEVQLSEKCGASVGINFKVMIIRDRNQERSTTTKISELLPEALVEAVAESGIHKIDGASDWRTRFVTGTSEGFNPGEITILSNGVFSKDGKDPIASLGSEECIKYRLNLGQYFIHAFGARSAEATFDSQVGQPIDVMGVLRYTAPYTIPGSISPTLGIRIGAIWLR